MKITDIIPGAVITQEYGWTSYARAGAYGGKIHDGIDAAAPYGTRINWPLPPSSVRTGWEPGGYGKFTVGYHGPYEMLFGHEAQTGNTGYAGLVNSTGYSNGNHTHLKVKLNGVTIDPIPWLNNIGVNTMNPDDEQYRELLAEVLYLYGPERPATRDERRSRFNKKAGEVYGDIMGSKEAYESLTSLFIQVYHLAFGPERKIVHGRDISPRIDRIIARKSTFLKEIADIADSPERNEYLEGGDTYGRN